MEDELLRLGVRRIKALAKLRVPEYDLPADSFLEDAVRDIFAAGVSAGMEKAAALCEEIEDRYRVREHLRFPENKTDAETGAADCAAAIRAAIQKE